VEKNEDSESGRCGVGEKIHPKIGRAATGKVRRANFRAEISVYPSVYVVNLEFDPYNLYVRANVLGLVDLVESLMRIVHSGCSLQCQRYIFFPDH
jgi:hypothetical protein